MGHRDNTSPRATRQASRRNAEDRSSLGIATRMASGFLCLADRCPSTCCSDWQVNIDKQTHDTLTQSVDQSVALIASTALVPYPTDKATPMSHSRIQMGDDGFCPFLSDQKLCQIQDRLGELALSPICGTYPREIYRSGTDLSSHAMVLSLSCPAAAESCVMDPEAMVETEIFEDQFTQKGRLIIRQMESGKRPLQDMLVRFLDTLMDQKGLGLFAQYIALRLFVNQTDLSNNASDVTPLTPRGDLVARYQAVAQQMEKVQSKTADLAYQADLLLEICRLGMRHQGPGSSFTRLLNRVFNILGPRLDRDSLAIKFQPGLSAFEDYVNDHPHVLKNYCINEFIRAVFKQGNGEPLVQWVDDIFFRMTLIRMVNSLLASQTRVVESEDFVETIWVVSRALAHNTELSRTLLHPAVPAGLDRIPTIGLLLATPPVAGTGPE